MKLRFPPQDEAVGFGAIPKLHLGSYESFPLPNAEAHRSVAHGKRQPGLWAFLKNNTRSRPAWQEIVDFS